MKHYILFLVVVLIPVNASGVQDLFQRPNKTASGSQLPKDPEHKKLNKLHLLSSTTAIIKKPPSVQSILRNSRAGSRRGRKHVPDPEPLVEPDSTTTRRISTKTAVTFGVLLALNSGIVNGVCLSGLLSADGTKQSSVAVTGAWTNSALAAASSNYDSFLFNTKCILSYMTGSFISGFLNPHPKAFEVSVGAIQAAFIVGSMLMYGSSVLSEEPDKVFIFLASMASGIQNSLTSTTTANLVRSAHFSGITSDMGTFLGQIVRGNMDNLVKFKTFFSLATAFWTGGYASYSLTKNYGKHVLMFSCILYLVLALAVGNI
jgi:uncharacterized membrane protein YoaK (UPF0700 family)